MRSQILLLTLLLLPHTAVGAPPRVSQVRVTPTSIVLASDAPQGATLYEAPLWADERDAADLIRVQELPPGVAEVTVDRVAGEAGALRDRLLSRWVVASGEGAGRSLSAPRFADEVAPRAELPRVLPRSKKGLGGYSAGRGPDQDLDALGITSVTVNIPLSFLRVTPQRGAIALRHAGREYWADAGAIARLDRTMAHTYKRNLLVLGILLMPRPDQLPPDVAVMADPNCDPGAHFAMPNVRSEQGMRLYAAALDFLCERYSRPSGEHGRIHHWIVHNEVDAGWEWTNAGELPLAEFFDLYYRSLRAVHLTARQYDPHAQAFVSLTHHWNAAYPNHGYSSRAILDLLLERCRTEGDFAWALAYHPYPASLLEPATWDDPGATRRLDTPKITPKNLEVLAEWACRPDTFFRGERQRVIHLSEQGLNSRDYSPRQLELQAAGLAYFWKKAAALPEIQAMQYHNWIDNRHEGGLRIGLRRFPDDKDDPLGKKPAWELYRAAGTPQEDEAFRFALPVIGVESWGDVTDSHEEAQESTTR
ncbi:hypothetical protein Pla175_10210 [Pirellulimonas nuda]|uniref:DUF5722 domain-containing protein n=1 Tax=Pirellulimonas nuda TaxID=2528009 RepID=A0A518D876_9BACT|nr:DUF5722 domain-containing protein [Pirellulimonas nuda]QDU87655.1 hypothetical protein Pla175_10210 [Pirellulimonas nuda]